MTKVLRLQHVCVTRQPSDNGESRKDSDMSLNRQSQTHSSRIMVPAYPALSLLVAAAYLLGSPGRTSTPSFDAAREIMPVMGYGWFFFVVASLEIIGLASRREFIYVLGLALGMGVCAAWAGFFFISVITVPTASFSAPGLWGFVALAHLATFRSLTKDGPKIRDVRTRERATD